MEMKIEIIKIRSEKMKNPVHDIKTRSIVGMIIKHKRQVM